jgi:hypothetical protein
MSLAVRAAFFVRDVIKKLNETKANKVVLLNDMFA